MAVAVISALLLLSLVLGLKLLGSDGVRQPHRQLLDHFRILGAPPIGLPTSIASNLGEAPFHADWGLARDLSPPGHSDAWVVPAGEQLCLIRREVDAALSVVCANDEQVLAHGIFITSLLDPSMQKRGPRREIIGIAPDGTAAVQLGTPNFKSVRVAVVHNVFVLRDDIPTALQSVRLLR